MFRSLFRVCWAVSLLALLLTGGSAAAATIQVYNQNNPPDAAGLPSGGWGTYRGFSVQFDDSALSATDPLTDQLPLTDLTLRHAGSQGATGTFFGDWTNALLKVYSAQNAAAASWVGDSLNTQDMSWGGAERNVSFAFDNLLLDADTTYFFYFSNAAGDPTEVGFVDAWSSGRLRVSNNSAHIYPSGNLINNSFANQDTAFDAVFMATFSPVPEPGTLALLGLGGVGLALLVRRRRRKCL